jgi:hypothetical protein
MGVEYRVTLENLFLLAFGILGNLFHIILSFRCQRPVPQPHENESAYLACRWVFDGDS